MLEKLRQRLAEITAKMKEYEAVENYTEEQLTEMDTLSAEYATVKKQIEAKEKAQEIVNASNASAGRKTAPEAPVTRVEVSASRTERMGGFKNFGEFLMSVKDASVGRIDKRFSNTMFERNGEDGGFLVPEEMVPSIAKKLQADESLLSRCTNIPVGGNTLSLPIDQTSPWSGGILAYWMSEGGDYTASQHKFGQANWRLNKLGALVKVTDELLQDAVGLQGYIDARAPEAIMHAVNKAILVGDGVGKPKGILNSGFKVKVLKESGQSADTVVAKNVINMYSRLIPQSRARAVWICNAQVEPQLRTMKDDLGNFIYLAPGSQLNQTPYGNLLGLPVISMLGAMPALGDEGDIMLVDFSYYYAITKSGGLTAAVSPHIYFLQDIQAFKFTFKVDGSCPYTSPVTTENGSYQMSGFITLEDR